MLGLDEAMTARVRAVKGMSNPWKEMPGAARAALISALSLDFGWSAADIAPIFGVTRNSIIGFAHRQKSALRKPPKAKSRPAAPRQPKPAAKDTPKPKPATPARPATKVAHADNQNADLSMEERPTRVHILDADYSHCRYPLWGDERKPAVSEMFYCGAVKADILAPYCGDCAARYRLSHAAARKPDWLSPRNVLKLKSRAA